MTVDILVNGEKLGQTDGLFGLIDHPTIALGETFSITVDVSPADAMANFEAVMMANHATRERPPLHLRVAMYSEADAMLGRALASGVLLGGDVADAYSWLGLRVSHAMVIGDVVTYVLVG